MGHVEKAHRFNAEGKNLWMEKVLTIFSKVEKV